MIEAQSDYLTYLTVKYGINVPNSIWNKIQITYTEELAKYFKEKGYFANWPQFTTINIYAVEPTQTDAIKNIEPERLKMLFLKDIEEYDRSLNEQ